MHTQAPQRFAPALCLALGLLAVPAGAQTTPPASTEATGPVVQMDPFVIDVSADNGYIATDSLAGGRNSMPVKLTPTTISSITEAFIGDLQLTDMRSVLQWTPNVVPVSWNGGHDGGGDVYNSWALNIRGGDANAPQGGSPPTVNYFPFWGVKDLFNVERVEVDRGPDSILFGVGNLGGVLSSYTKTPRFDKDFENIDLVFDSFGGVRGTADVNVLSDSNKLGTRINILGDRDEGWRTGDLTKKWGASMANTWKITDATTVRFDVEAFKQETPQFSMNLTDNYSQWDHATNSATWGATPVGSAATDSMAEWGGTTGTLVWIPEDRTLMNWGLGYRGAGLSDGPYYYNAVMRPYAYQIAGTNLTVPALPSRDFTVGPQDGVFTWQYYTLNAYLDQRISPNCEFELAAYRYSDNGNAINFESPGNVYVDINKQMPNGQTNPHYGELYSDMFLDKQIQDHSANEFRGQFNYHFDATVLGVPVYEWLSASGGEEFHLLRTRQYIATAMNGYNPNNWTEYMVWGREYYDDPNLSMHLPSSYNGNPIVYLPLPFNWFDHDLTEETKYGGLVSQTRLWGDRVNLTLGARRDDYSSDLINVRGTGNIPTIESASGNTYSAGLVGYVTKWFGLTYNYSENFAPIGGGVAPSLFGAEFGPATGKSNSFGFRVSTEDQRYYLSADYYIDKALGRITGDSIPLQSIWNDYFAAGGTATDIGPAGSVTGSASSDTLHANMSYADTEDVKNEGFEVEGVANPTPNWRIQASFSAPKSVVDNDLPGSAAYFAEHLAEWTPQIALGTAKGGTYAAGAGDLQNDITNSEQTLADTSGSKTNAGVVKTTASLFTVYTFSQDWARGIGVGGGVTALGAQNISTGGTLSSPSYQLWSALLSYSTRLGSARVKLQLNCDNLFGSKALVFTGFNTYGSLAQGSNYYFVTPRKLTFSAAFSF